MCNSPFTSSEVLGTSQPQKQNCLPSLVLFHLLTGTVGLERVLYSNKLSRISRFSAFSRKLDSRKAPKIAIREKLSRKFLVTFQFTKVYPVNFFCYFQPHSFQIYDAFLKSVI